MSYELSDGELAVNSNDGKIYVKANGYVTCVSDTYATKSYSASAITSLENICKTLHEQVLMLEQQVMELTKRLPPKTWLEEAGSDMENL
jgi:predicted heme/steroid binding protein